MGGRLNTGWSSSFSGLLAFVLSAAMAMGFIALVNMTHDLLSPSQCDKKAAIPRQRASP